MRWGAHGNTTIEIAAQPALRGNFFMLAAFTSPILTA
jgi:hypothetical protein